MTEQNKLQGTPETNSKMAQPLEKEMASVIQQLRRLNRRIDKLNHRLAELPETQGKSLTVDGGDRQEKKGDNSLSVLYRLPRPIKKFNFDLLLVKDEKEGDSYGITLLFPNYKMLLLSLVIALGLNAFFIPPARSPENILPQEIDRVENIDPGGGAKSEEN
ncbi:MAG: hypothetical protein SXA11_23085 [Cyanobacteriota bacterium]|nr:hypothetical protein [Cyanobacteriota bacterium]